MTINNPTPTPSFEDEIRAAMATPQAHPQFVNALGTTLMRQATSRPVTSHRHRATRLAWAVAFVILVLLVAGVLTAGPQRVLAVVRSWFGYLPGIGYVQTNASLRVLPAPRSQERDGITLTVEQAVTDAQRTIILYRVDGIQPKHRPESEAGPSCGGQSYLRLPDGSKLVAAPSGGGGWPSGYSARDVFPAVPQAVDQFTLVIPCLNDTKPGAAPENWEMSLNLAPAPADFDVRPVVEIPTQKPVPTVALAAGGFLTNAQSIQFTAERIVELEDGYRIEGRFSWQGTSVTTLDYIPYWMALVDAHGQEFPTEAVQPDDIGNAVLGQHRAWAVRTNTKNFHSPFTLTLSSLVVTQPTQVTLDLDLGELPKPGQVWELNRNVDIAGRSMRVLSATLISQQDGHYRLEIRSQTSPDEIVFASLWDRDNDNTGASGGNSSADGLTTTSFNYNYLPVGVRHIQVAGVSYVLRGPWTLSLSLPKVNTSAPAHTAQPATCLTADRWRQLKTESPTSLPEGVSGRILVAGPVQAGMTFPTLYVVNLDGSQKTVIGPGAWASLSSDGKRVAYAYSDGMHVVDLDTERNTRLSWSQQNDYHPVWSPDGQHLAFNRDGIYIASLDGSDIHKVPETTTSSALAGWMPDGARLVVATLGPDGSQLQTVDTETGEMESHFLFENRKSQFAMLSPDGKRVAFSEMIFGQSNYGLYVANLDGTGKRLVAGVDEGVSAVTAVWSPDGGRLLVSGFEQKSGSTIEAWSGFVVQPETCQVSPLPAVDGEVTGWR
ncbi:MAG: DUF4179 domain-containing protein [Chloroflexi bacterium]|nr:DUF4179 domain-containing protein [Chloroflexota bacterium]